MNKKVVIILSIIGVLIIGGIVGILCYRNSPDYVMKQYVKAYETEDDELLKNIVLVPDRHEVIPFNKKSVKRKIIDYSFIKTTDKKRTHDYVEAFMGKKYLENVRVGKTYNYSIKYIENTREHIDSKFYIVKLNNKYKILFYNSLEHLDL